MMKTWKNTIHRLFIKSSIENGSDAAQNIYAFRFIFFCLIMYTVESILNIADIFIVDKRIFSAGYLVACLFGILYLILLLSFGLEYHMTKYISITAITCIIASASISLTYHMVIILMIPIIIAGMYPSKKLSVYTFILTICSIIVSTYAGYYYGVCDANMALLTATSLNHLEKEGEFLLTQVNRQPIETIGLYFVFPRCLVAVAFAYVSISVNKLIRSSQIKALKMEVRANQDEMTGLYNKNKLLGIIENKVYDNQRVAVVYWDVNSLKLVNDQYGHLAGDQLIVKVAKSIQNVAGEGDIALRYGGDEFLMILPQGTREKAEQVIARWNQEIEKMSADCEFPVSASVGYAAAEQERLKDVIAVADHNMYLCKKKAHQERKDKNS